MSAEQLVRMFFNESLYVFERAYEHTPFSFGGPLEEDLWGVRPKGPRPLHLVARLMVGRFPEIWSVGPMSELPLIYGFCYDGCEISYRVKPGGVEILELSPMKSCEDFPYENYPVLLPWVPLKLGETRPCSYAEFAEDIPNMVDQQPADLIAVVSPPATLGISLWGRHGDPDLIFECNLAEKTVRAYNRCT